MFTSSLVIRVSSISCFVVAALLAYRTSKPAGELVVPTKIDLGRISSPTEFVLDVKNTSLRSINVAGARVDCGCLMPKGLPLTIAPESSVQLEVEFDPIELEVVGRHRLELQLQLLANTKVEIPPTFISATVEVGERPLENANSLEPVPLGQ